MPLTVTKEDLAKLVSEDLHTSLVESNRYVTAVVTAITDSIVSGNEVSLRKFGTFSTYDSTAKMHARNPRTGETVQVPSKRRIKFKTAKTLTALLADAKAAE